MEFAAVNNTKQAAKTVAITLTQDEAKNPANAFAALLNLGAGVRFNAEAGLSQVEGQWMRAQGQVERDPAPKPKADNDHKPKEKVSATEAPANDDHDNDVAATDAANDDNAVAPAEKPKAASGETQATEQTAAVGLEALQAVSIQFQILVQMPNGSLQDMGTFDLQALMAAAQQNPDLAAALEAAFGQAGDALAAGQSLLGELAQTAAVDPALAAAAQQLDATALADAGDTAGFAELFKQIAAAFRPAAQQASTQTKTTTAAQIAQAAAGATEHADAALDLRSPEAVKQSEDLSRILGGNDKIRIQVAVNGQKVADLPFEYSQFNRYSGYNPTAMRSASTANGQTGQAQAGNAMALVAAAEVVAPPQQVAATASVAAAPLQPTVTVAPSAPSAPAAPIAAPAMPTMQTNVGGQQNANSGALPRNDAAPVRAPDAAAPAPAPAAAGSSGTQSQPSNFATALNQANGNAATTQAQATERPAPAQPQQVIEQIKVNITRAAKAGMDRVTILLRPEALGRVEIKLELTEQGQVRANVTADNPATLELLQREARGLERALQDAGLRTDSDDLQFNLRSDADGKLAQNEGERNGPGGNARNAGRHLSEEEAQAEDMYDYAQAATLRGGIDTYV